MAIEVRIPVDARFGISFISDWGNKAVFTFLHSNYVLEYDLPLLKYKLANRNTASLSLHWESGLKQVDKIRIILEPP